jgi:hypothetical protein
VDSFSAEWAVTTVDQLTRLGVELTSGLDESDFAAVNVAFGVPVPPELRALLGIGVPVSPGWARWHEGADVVAAKARGWIDHVFIGDITAKEYWHTRFGDRASSTDDAIQQALRIVHAARLLSRCTATDSWRLLPKRVRGPCCQCGKRSTPSSMATTSPIT